MELAELQRNWNAFGDEDPLWAILTRPGKRGRQWDPEEFFRTGEQEVSRVLDSLAARDFPLLRHRALDFGCGVGRLTQALCRHFDRCDGVDIAPSMIRLARQLNRHGERCHYHLHESNDLALFPDSTFTFVYSLIVLQHMEPRYSRGYIREFLRVLAPGGVLVFQLPSEPASSRQPLPWPAFKAFVAARAALLRAPAGSQVVLSVRVKNMSDVTWPAEANVRLGNHWRDEGGQLLQVDDGRTSLPADLGPWEEVDLDLAVVLPPTPGRYVLELDLVQEHVAWFKDRGSLTDSVRVQALPSGDEGATAAAPEVGGVQAPPTMEMYGLPQAEVLELIAECGGQVVQVQEDHSAGPEWHSYFYYVTRPATAS